MLQRCPWANQHPLLQEYHDQEWGTPVHKDDELFERFTLELFQAGLSWLTILRKRENFRKAFAYFDIQKVASFGLSDVERLINDAGIIRNRKKITATINNAQRILLIQEEFGSFDRYIWSLGAGNLRGPLLPGQKFSTSREAESMARELKTRGFQFIGPIMCYSFMQSVGMVNDHVPGCFRWEGKR